jgi:hypothetical protein
MVLARGRSSGTTERIARCPSTSVLGTDGWIESNGHDWLWRTTYAHALTGCCCVQEVQR